MKTLGLDVSLDTCKNEGYLMVECNGEFDKAEYYRIFAHYPDYIVEESKGLIEPDTLMLDTLISWNTLYERYLQYETAINDFADTADHVIFDDPGYQDLLMLANDVNAYCGLD